MMGSSVRVVVSVWLALAVLWVGTSGSVTSISSVTRTSFRVSYDLTAWEPDHIVIGRITSGSSFRLERCVKLDHAATSAVPYLAKTLFQGPGSTIARFLGGTR